MRPRSGSCERGRHTDAAGVVIRRSGVLGWRQTTPSRLRFGLAAEESHWRADGLTPSQNLRGIGWVHRVAIARQTGPGVDLHRFRSGHPTRSNPRSYEACRSCPGSGGAGRECGTRAPNRAAGDATGAGASRQGARALRRPLIGTDSCGSVCRDNRQYTETSRIWCCEEHRRFPRNNLGCRQRCQFKAEYLGGTLQVCQDMGCRENSADHRTHCETQGAGQPLGQVAPTPDHATCGADDSRCGRSVWTRHGAVQDRARLCSVVRARAKAAIIGR